ncbi:aspartyl protease family protein [Parasphingorhabdus halotolerans]|uniref:Peptidase A2A n=1 Tax=Parasphingorhabdus halotolerans TaxID=2725558 RepID=A0A6H2DLT8_9SPHN|nr:aspartyl protease family protein [Parasphingorhabdus halotolerans]QJB69642.1 peptidase A2A [Parasphingorhabdus halotolerans]
MPSISAIFAPALLASSLSFAYPVPMGQSIAPGSLTDSDSDTVTIDEDRVRRMTVPVSIEGRGPFSFVIDTGAERTVVSEMIAERLGLEAEEQAELISIAGRSMVDMVYVPELTMGRKSYGSLIAPVLKGRHIGADGILGLDSLQNRRVLFDFLNKELSVENADAASSTRGYREIIVTGKRRSGQLIFTKATVSGIPVDVVIDTGGEVTIGNFALQRKLRRQARDGDQSSLIAVTGETLGVDMGLVRDFRMDRAGFANMLVAFADAPPFKQLNLERKPAILLGMDTLRKFDKVAIDFEKRRVHLVLPKEAMRFEGIGAKKGRF